MLETLKKWLGFSGRKKTAPKDAPAVCCRTLADVPKTLDLQGKTIVVCRGDALTLRKESERPDRLAPGEVCWIVPGGDVRLPLDFQYETSQVRTEAVIRFEADAAFARYAATVTAAGDDRITRESLARFVAGQWCELLSLQGIDPEQLGKADAATTSTFRTHLSLLLQESGFRCVALESISVSGLKKTPETAEEFPADASRELDEAVAEANSEEGWNRLLDQLDDAGFRPSAVDAERLDFLGREYLDKKVSPEKTSLQIRKMIRRNNLETALIAEDVSRWNATDIKFRLLDDLDKKPEEFSLHSGSGGSGVSKAPSTWLILRRQKVDEKLRQYLKSSVGQLETRLESAIQRQKDIAGKSKFVRSQATLRRISDKIRMLPGLSTGGQGFRQKRLGYGELIEAVRCSITAVQLTDGILMKLADSDYMEAERDSLVADLEATLQTLESEIGKRKNVYGI